MASLRCLAASPLPGVTSWTTRSQRPPAVAVRASGERASASTGVFQTWPNPHMTLSDVRDAVEACDVQGATPEQRRRCYETFGIDVRKVDAYYLPVMGMEERLADQDDDTGRKVAGAGSLLFAIFLARKLLTMGNA